MPFVGGPNTLITNPTWRTVAILEKSKNCHISAKVRPIAAKFGMVTHFGRPEPSCPKMSTFWKSTMAAAAILKTEKMPYLTNDLTDRRKIWHGDAFLPFEPSYP